MAVLLAAAMLTSTVFASGQPEPSDETLSAAAEAGVDVLDLMGAMDTTGLDARPYLQAVGELAPPTPVFSVWDRIAACESRGNWSANTGNGFYGGVQFDYGSWVAAGGRKYADRADHASRAQQIEIANNWLHMTGWRSWPACSHLLGLR